MKLVGFGDSFTAGYIRNDIDVPDSYKISYIAKLCDIPGSRFTSWENRAKGGYSNTHISWSVFDYVNTRDCADEFLLIAWSIFARTAAYNTGYQDNHPWDAAFRYFDAGKDYYPASSKLIMYETDLRILATAKLLESRSIPYAMICSFSDHNLHPHCCLPKLPNWINQKRENNTLLHMIAGKYLDEVPFGPAACENRDDHSWTDLIDRNQYITDCYHPSREGHELIAQILHPLLEPITK